MLAKRLIKSNDAGGGACTNTVDLYNPFPDGGGVALYQLNGDATDVSGNYDGTASNVTYGAGQFGQAGVFNGSSSVIDIPANIIPTNFVASISVWVKGVSLANSGSTDIIFQNANGGAFFALITQSNVLELFTRNSSATNYRPFQYSLSNFNTTDWYHICVTFSGLSNAVNLYVNGVNVDSGSLQSTSISYTFANNIGNESGNTIGWNGSIDQVRIFNRALRPYEVEALYTEEYCTPTIVPSEHFNTVLYTGTGATNPVTGVGFQPDFVWLKKRSGVDDHFVFDSIRGAKSIYPNLTNAEDSFTFSFDTDGFTVPVSGGTNGNGDTFVAWNFKAGGAAVTNTDGTITSQVSANTEAGFSVVSWTGNGISGASVGHGLNSVPNIIITKDRTLTKNWNVYSSAIGNDRIILLNTDQSSTIGDNYNDTTPTNEVFYNHAGNPAFGSQQNILNDLYVSYCFAEVEGFSNFGSYVGNGSTSGPTVITGFEPAFIMVKCSSSTGDWVMLDNKRTIENPRNKALWANLSNAEATGYSTDFLENGFQIKDNGSALNASGGSYIYMAFATDPTAVEPTLEDSFNTVLYDGNNSTNPITTVGFQPDMVWIKNRDAVTNHALYDSVRGVNKRLVPSGTNTEISNSSFPSFDDNGFTLASDDTSSNKDLYSYVAWNWKGAEIPAINSNGSISSVVSANPAAGFSIVSYTGNGVNGATAGHGLSAVPNVVIWKNRSDARNWIVWHSHLTSIDYHLILNSTSAEVLDSRTNRPFGQPTDSVLVLGEDNETNFSPNNFIAYCFAEVAGFSKFGSYVGNGLPLGPSIDLGFEPAFVMYKCTTQVGNWIIVDNKRAITNPRTPHLRANSSSADDFGAGEYINFIANGFQPSGVSNFNNNSNGQTYIYMAFANQF